MTSCSLRDQCPSGALLPHPRGTAAVPKIQRPRACHPEGGPFPRLTDSECVDGRRQLRSEPSGFHQPSLAQAG